MQYLVKRARELARRQREATVPTEECFDPELIDELADNLVAMRTICELNRSGRDRFQGEKDQM